MTRDHADRYWAADETPVPRGGIRRVAAVLLLGFAAVAFLLTWFFAAGSLTGVEPNAEFIDCGPALIGRPSPLPDPSCADAYGFVVLLSLFFGLAGAASLIGSAWLLVRANGRRLRLR